MTPLVSPFSAIPAAEGLYDPDFEHDACGVAFVVDARGRRSHLIVAQALTALRNLSHRGAAGAEPSSGDGAGLLLQVPDEFLRAVAGVPPPAPGGHAVGQVFLPTDPAAAARARALVQRTAEQERLAVLGWREVPTDPTGLGPTALSVMPRFGQLFAAAPDGAAGDVLERRAYCLRKRAE